MPFKSLDPALDPLGSSIVVGPHFLIMGVVLKIQRFFQDKLAVKRATRTPSF